MASSSEPSEAARWARTQAISGLCFALFLVVHLTNTLLAPLGPGVYDGYQRVARIVYRHPLVELGLMLVPLIVHVVAGMKRIRLRPRGGTPSLRVRLHRYAAYYLLVFIAGHWLATRGPSLVYGFDPGFAGLSYTLTRYGWFFYPYYALLALSGLYHGLVGVQVALGTLGVRLPSGMKKGPGLYVPTAILGAGLLVALLAFGGVLFPIHDPMDNDFARLLESLASRAGLR